MNKPKWKNGGLDEQVNTIRHYETSGACAAASAGAHRKEWRWCGHGWAEQAERHVLVRCMLSAHSRGQAQKSNNDLCYALYIHHKRFAQHLYYSSLQTRHNAHNAVISADTSCTRVRLPCKRTHAVTAAAPQATEQAFNNTATIVASSTVASSAVALRSATAKCPAARHAAQRPDQPCGKTSSFSAVTQHSTSFESAPHWPCSNTRATAPTAHASSVPCAQPQPSVLSPTALPLHTQAACLVRPQSSALPHTSHHHADGRAVRWPRWGVVPQPSRHHCASPLTRRVYEQRGYPTRTGTLQGMAAVTAKHSPQPCRNSKPRVGRSNSKPAAHRTKLQSAWRCCRAHVTL
ncbi:hypothetical protein TRVL_10364 [Trypanosoma vivax]|nr:hypothetical protein TRVL_10364 [Trypanosoma vivax]